MGDEDAGSQPMEEMTLRDYIAVESFHLLLKAALEVGNSNAFADAATAAYAAADALLAARGK